MTDTASKRFFKYIVCVDEREECRVALKLACEKAKLRGGGITLLHVVTPPDFQSLTGVADRMEEEQRAEAESLMQRLAAEVQAAGGPVPVIVLRSGQIGEEILAAVAEEIDAGLVVVGVAENTGTRGRLTAFLATQLGGGLLIPLLLVPGNLTDRQLEALI